MDRLVRFVEKISHIKTLQIIILKHSLNCTKCFKIFIHKCVFKCHIKTSHRKCAKDFHQIFTHSIILISLLKEFQRHPQPTSNLQFIIKLYWKIDAMNWLFMYFKITLPCGCEIALVARMGFIIIFLIISISSLERFSETLSTNLILKIEDWYKYIQKLHCSDNSLLENLLGEQIIYAF